MQWMNDVGNQNINIVNVIDLDLDRIVIPEEGRRKKTEETTTKMLNQGYTLISISTNLSI
ncbi:437_t:CDS:2 [Entrophospora sp. SA101]|nr:891_t:CDS:2 [Entrophospora sp. SA101]CAJ0913252.1 437_t:CDS:2 [Entrophospora sp. SA101]